MPKTMAVPNSDLVWAQMRYCPYWPARVRVENNNFLGNCLFKTKILIWSKYGFRLLKHRHLWLQPLLIKNVFYSLDPENCKLKRRWNKIIIDHMNLLTFQ